MNIQANDISKVYAVGSNEAVVLSNVNLHIRDNEFISITSPSGRGKSTLLGQLVFKSDVSMTY